MTVGRRVSAALAGVIVAGAVLRFATLDVQSYWIDEVFTILIVRRPLGEVLPAVVDTESTPPLYYLVAWVWAKVFGVGEVGLRSLSALCGTATVAIVFALARQVAGSRAGLVAAALAAVNPFLVWYSQEARSYALLALLGTASLLVVLRARERPTPRRLAAWAALCVLALLTHYFAAFLVAAECLLLLTAVRTRAAVAWAACVAAGGAALVPLAVTQRENSVFLADQSLAQRAQGIPKELVLGGRGSEVDVPAVVAVAALLVLGGVTIVLIALARRRLSPEVELCAAIAAWVIAAPLALDLAGLHVVTPRNLILVVPVGLVVVSAGLAQARRPGSILAVALVVLGLAVCVWTNLEPELQREGLRWSLSDLPSGHP